MSLLFKNYPFLLLALLLASCSDKDIDYANRTAEDIFDEADKQLKEKDYKKAAKTFAEIERNHPYSDCAIKGQLLSAYAFYQANLYEEATEAFGVFIQLHPGHEKVPYALYMRGICGYEQIPIVARDQESALEGLAFFNDLIERFPNTKYAEDAKIKCDLIKDHLAAKEMEIGIYYMNVYSYISAINRFKHVVDEYKTSRQVVEAYYRLVEAYKALGILDQAKVYENILSEKYPDNKWTKKAQHLLAA
jgi:outer membrane protein assembly factor BamD